MANARRARLIALASRCTSNNNAQFRFAQLRPTAAHVFTHRATVACAVTSVHVPPNAAVQRPRDHVSSAPHVHNEMAHLRRARDAVSRSAATACYAASRNQGSDRFVGSSYAAELPG
jgi:hypothetical protein